MTDKLEKNPHYVKEMLKDFKDTPLTEVVEKCLKLNPKERGNLSDIEIILTKVHRDDNTLDDEMHTPVGQNSFDVLKIFNYFRTRRFECIIGDAYKILGDTKKQKVSIQFHLWI